MTLLCEASANASGSDAVTLRARADALVAAGRESPRAIQVGLDDELALLMRRTLPRRFEVAHAPHDLRVGPERARFSAWYELFPRSAGGFGGCQEWLGYIAEMGFDVLYLPPIHPIGRSHRKGKNNSTLAAENDVGSPWAIGAREGGHRDVHPELGTLADFEQLCEAARARGIEVAMDLAFQCSPDHPYVRAHPDWFRRRPDGSIQYAENPPKKYEDIVPLDFECEDWRGLWEELARAVELWVERGVRIFRVDNPHTKPFRFWDWLIDRIHTNRPDVIFLAEAFARPAVMYRLAKGGFDQSYTYFAWKNSKWELEQYFIELTRSDVADYFRPNAWPNTPDILNEFLQVGGRPAFAVRAILAATLCASYGIYGPAFELCEGRAAAPGSEEYLDSEKYQLRRWELDAPHSLRDLLGRLNRARRAHSALQFDRNLWFHRTDNEQIICYSKRSPDGQDVVLVVANLDPFHRHAAWVELDLDRLGLRADRAFAVRDLIGDARFLWTGPRNFVEVDPDEMPAHVFAVQPQVRTELDFDYFA